jgi:hypothetical protein
MSADQSSRSSVHQDMRRFEMAFLGCPAPIAQATPSDCEVVAVIVFDPNTGQIRYERPDQVYSKPKTPATP